MRAKMFFYPILIKKLTCQHVYPTNKIVKKKPWTFEEDQILVKLVDRFGAQKWSTIAANMPGKF